MVWNEQQIAECKIASEKVTKIIFEAFYLIKKYDKVTEYEVQQYIHSRYKEEGLVSDQGQIVAFRSNTGFVHYYPKKKSKTLKPNTLILIDCWARLNKPKAPYCDTTWMAFYGKKVPRKVQEVFNIMIKARDEAVFFIENKLKKGILPIGSEIDAISRKIISDAGYGDNFLHTLGHSLGNVSPHGTYGGLSKKYKKELKTNLGYTIEPGIYFKNKFGVRSEIDFYITDKNELVLLTPLQDKIVTL